jgi:hypothetical protein
LSVKDQTVEGILYAQSFKADEACKFYAVAFGGLKYLFDVSADAMGKVNHRFRFNKNNIDRKGTSLSDCSALLLASGDSFISGYTDKNSRPGINFADLLKTMPQTESGFETITEDELMPKKPENTSGKASGLIIPADTAAIDSGKVACYVTDFPNGKTANVPRVIAIPHLGASTPESEDNCAIMAALQIIDYVENGNIVNSVNMPTATLARSGDPRICVIHKNIPDMISKITGAVSSCGINIENMVNASTKGRLQAYTIIDAQSIAAGLEDKIRAIDGVLRVRTIC